MMWLGLAIGLPVGTFAGYVLCGLLTMNNRHEAKLHAETCRERLAREYPRCVGVHYIAGCSGCPEEYGYAREPSWCDNTENEETCARFWDRPVEVDE